MFTQEVVRKKLVVAAFNCLLLIGFFLILQQLMLVMDLEAVGVDASLTDVIFLFLLSASLLLVSSCSWRMLLYVASGYRLPLSAAVEQTALMLVAKYIPGKVWGILVRVSTADRFGVKPADVAAMSILEQLVILYVALSLGGIFVVSYHSIPLALGLMFGFIFCGYYFCCWFCRLVNTLLKHPWLKGRFGEGLDLSIFDVRTYLRIVAFYCLMWCLIASVIWTFLQWMQVDLSVLEFFAVLGGYMVAVAIGFLAIFSPGGVGVRESVFVGLSNFVLPLPVLLQLVVMLRLWNILFDLASGISGYVIYLRCSRRDRKFDRF